ncbi:PLP-dependent transferase [Serendipita vermifera]|nr:PLP-dependent transferase [Serendipita vermifera]
MLFQNIRTHQIYGANTDVGKTIVATTLALSTAIHQRRVFYLKPVSTGPDWEADHKHIRRYTPKAAKITAKCLIQMDDPVSPHLAALSAIKIHSDQEILDRIRLHAETCVHKDLGGKLGALYVETAGGVMSPTPSGTPQADAYRPLRLPVVLVGDSKLGGISTTIAAYESLTTRGYDVESVVMFMNDRYKNHEYLTKWLGRRGVVVTGLDAPPSRLEKRLEAKDEENMKHYYADASTTSTMRSLVSYLDHRHERRIEHLKGAPGNALSTFWYPFTQHNSLRSGRDITVIDSAHGDSFATIAKVPGIPERRKTSNVLSTQFDGSASWWTQGIGHSNPELNAVASYAAGRYGHVIFPQAVHEPALDLAKYLLQNQGKGWASRVFFSDNGSTGMEVALKMALQATASTYPPGEVPELGVLGLSGSYHGDTIGAMDACEGGIYNSKVLWYKGKGAWLEPPCISFENGSLCVELPWDQKKVELESVAFAYDVEKRHDTLLKEIYRQHISSSLDALIASGHHFGALVLEPLVLGAGGMRFVDPLFQNVLVETVRSRKDLLPESKISNSSKRIATLPVIFDEVFAGLGRLGFSSPSTILRAQPDIAVYAKLLTGGLLPLAATISTNAIFEVFLGDHKANALLHGHSYTAYPVGCAVACKALQLQEEVLSSLTWSEARERWSTAHSSDKEPTTDQVSDAVPCSLWSPLFIRQLSESRRIKRVMTLGTVLAFEVEGEGKGQFCQTHENGETKVHYIDEPGYGSSAAERALHFLKDSGGGPTDEMSVHLRTLGNVGYLITNLNTEKSMLRRLEKRLLHIFHPPSGLQ